jgi:O-antigen/teichoic acid export membrane protein
MVALVSSRQLGLYALAVTIATGSGSLISSTASALYPRVAAGDAEIAARSCRVTLLIVVVSSAAIAAVSPWIVPFIWGSRFSEAVPMLVVLLAASAVYVPAQVLGSALTAAGNPSPAATAQTVALIVTIPALILLLPSTGGLGAAWISFGGYAIAFVITTRAARNHFSFGYSQFLIASPADLRWLWGRIIIGPLHALDARRRGSAG